MKIKICNICKNIIDHIEDRKVPIMCCGQRMELLEANTQEDVSLEKHMPVVKLEDNILNVTVGEVLHPSTEAHYIGFISIKMGDVTIRRDITVPNDPVASFDIGNYKGLVEVYEWCNLHGLWKTSIEI